MDKKIEKNFAKWLDKILKKNNFEDSVAFNFNLYEGEGTFHIQLVSTSSFDENDEDWVCDEVYTSGENILIIPRSASGETWEEGLSFCKTLASNYLANGKLADKLKSKSAVGIGFVDGDIEILFKQ